MIAASRADLVQDATLAIDSEMARRGLSYQEARAKKREVTRLEIKEMGGRQPSPWVKKYVVSRMNGWRMLLLILGPLTLVISLESSHTIPKDWTDPIFFACMGTVLPVSAGQPWLMKTVSFWPSLVISCAVQLLVGHWIVMHSEPYVRNGIKGAGILAIPAGYAVGLVLYMLLQSLKSKEDPQLKSL